MSTYAVAVPYRVVLLQNKESVGNLGEQLELVCLLEHPHAEEETVGV